MKTTYPFMAAFALAATVAGTLPAAADLSPWEKFCLVNSDPGKDLGNCLDGLPSRPATPGSLTAPVKLGPVQPMVLIQQ